MAQQSLNLWVGRFLPVGTETNAGTVITGRAAGDVLAGNFDFLVFNMKDFNATPFGADFLIGLGDKFDAGLGAGFQTRTVPSVYAEFVNSNGNEIEQDLKLRMTTFTATIRVLPLGHNGVAPYIGGGVGVFGWHYSETGEFLGTDGSIFRGDFVGKGTTTGPVILGGVRVPVGSVGIGGELRYQKAKGDLPSDQSFAGSVIDLGGFSGLFTVNFRF